MKITVQIAVKSTPAQPDLIRQVARLERGPSLVPATLGRSLACVAQLFSLTSRN